tara:strand:- start:50716 stop:51645 length:930 start_codon:yes stop_codon:yes gene_type:complete
MNKIVKTQSKNFINLHNIPIDRLNEILSFSHEVKKDRHSHSKLLIGKSLILLFDKPSTRTRVSFELAIQEMGGVCIYLTAANSQLGRGESIKDTARVLSGYVDCVIIRNDHHKDLETFAADASIPVINALTDLSHPCQIMADLMTLQEHYGSLEKLKITWIGDGNNVANTWIQASVIFGFQLSMAIPEEYTPNRDYIEIATKMGNKITITEDLKEAVRDTNCLVTDTWVSMSDPKEDIEKKINTLKRYQVNEDLLSMAPNDAVFLHCLPAHRGQEVSDEVIDGNSSLVYQQAENRLHIQKGIIKYSLDL